MRGIIPIGLAAVVLLGATSARALADVVAGVTITNTTGSNHDAPYTVGWTFHTNAQITVSGLGVFVPGTNGLVESHPVAIWGSGADPVAQTIVAAGDKETLISQFRYHMITPVTLAANQDYTIGALYLLGMNDANEDQFVYPSNVTGLAANASITVTSKYGVYAPGTDLTQPTTEGNEGPGYFGPNFLIQTPEPTSLTLLGIGALGFAGHFWRRSKHATQNACKPAGV
jgi:hypothetical protein